MSLSMSEQKLLDIAQTGGVGDDVTLSLRHFYCIKDILSIKFLGGNIRVGVDVFGGRYCYTFLVFPRVVLVLPIPHMS
jgi:hypothetical protein